MARQLRIENAGAAYQVMARGNQGRRVSDDDLDRSVGLLRTNSRERGQELSEWSAANIRIPGLTLLRPDLLLLNGNRYVSIAPVIFGTRDIAVIAAQHSGGHADEMVTPCPSRLSRLGNASGLSRGMPRPVEGTLKSRAKTRPHGERGFFHHFSMTRSCSLS